MSMTPHAAVAPRPNGSTPAHALARHTTIISISDERVAKLAYEKYVARGCVHGFDKEDWAQAKRELLADALVKA